MATYSSYLTSFMLDIWSLARQQYLEECQKRTVRQQDAINSYINFTGSDLQTSDTRLIICGSKNCVSFSNILIAFVGLIKKKFLFLNSFNTKQKKNL
ncbi:unnamed protein product [Wuchereria bancrofti]|uniref:Uncharacterized protein n=1 Tax=Wuchereria bancrofti TaxID=6293 RepID=A0A3P7G2M1_WUCBA|nr:unnamed protein product [Wuchereria bancrofti]